MNPLIDEKHLSRARLDTDYNARATVSPDQFDEEMARYRAATDRARQSCARDLDVVYDAESAQTLDIYGPPKASGDLLPVFIFIHGGYWRALSKDDSGMMAEGLAARGAATVAVDYRLAPQVTLAEIVREVRAAVAFIWHEGARYGLDRNRISVGGSSAGGHLVGEILAAGWHEAMNVPEDLVTFALPISGLFELAPLSNTFAQDWLHLDDQLIAACSPIRHIGCVKHPVTIAWADHEPAGFRRQSAAFAARCTAAGASVRVLEIPHCNHFNVLMEFQDECSVLSQALYAGVLGDI